MTDEMPGKGDGPFCPICQQPLFGRPIWLDRIGNCHDTCVRDVVQTELDARTGIDKLNPT